MSNLVKSPDKAPPEPAQFVVWRPNPGPQTRFLCNPEREVLYGGAAGAGKSDGLLMSAVLDYKNRFHRGIIFRQSYPELKDLIRRSVEVYPYLGARYRSSTREWLFPSGAIVEFGYMEKKNDHLKYKRAWNFIGFDELTHWPTNGKDADGIPCNTAYVYMLSRLRSVAGTNLRLRVRSTTNPGGPGHEWVRARFRIPDDGTYSESFDRRTMTFRVFIPGRIADCPQLAGTSYELDLDALPEETRKMLKDGRWDVTAGAMFSEFDHRKHTCDAFALPYQIKLWRGSDDGFNAPACVLWFAEMDRRIYVVGELYRDKMTPEIMAEEVKRRDLLIPLRDADKPPVFNTNILRGAIDSSAFNESGMGPASGTGRGQKMNSLGCNWSPAQKGPGSRIAGANMIHSVLKALPDGKPGLIIFKNCKNLIRTLPTLPRDEGNVEDVDTDSEDHAYDGLRYGLQYSERTVKQTKLSGL